MLEKLFTEPKATQLEKAREAKREKHKIIFSCFNALYPKQGTRVFCKLGRKINPGANDGGIDLLSVLAGRSGQGCKNCKDRVEE